MSGFTLDIFPSKLGGGLPGGQPKGGLIGGGDGNNGGSGMEGASTRARDRNILRKAFGNHVFVVGSLAPLDIPRDSEGQSRWRTSPFRVAENAGDILGTVNMHPNMALPGGYNQINGIGPSQLHATKSANGVKKSNSGAAYSGNPKFVYDGSDYTRFKKLQAKNRNYNDKSFGGDDFHSTFVPLKRVRH
jgi:hypothetical protein